MTDAQERAKVLLAELTEARATIARMENTVRLSSLTPGDYAIRLSGMALERYSQDKLIDVYAKQNDQLQATVTAQLEEIGRLKATQGYNEKFAQVLAEQAQQLAEAQATIARYVARDKAMAESPAQHWEDALRCAIDERDQLQATVTAQQEEIGRLCDGQHKAALYDFILELSRLELAEMSPSARAAWDRLVKGGWYTDDLEKLLQNALASGKETT